MGEITAQKTYIYWDDPNGLPRRVLDEVAAGATVEEVKAALYKAKHQVFLKYGQEIADTVSL